MLHHIGTQEIFTARLLLRRFQEEDADMMFLNWANDPDVARYVTWDAHTCPAETRELLTLWKKGYENPNYYNWAIEYQGILIGNLSVVGAQDENLCCEIGYCLGKAYWNKGITTEALIAVLDFLFGQVGYHRITAVHDGANVASGRVMRKAGLREEGTRRQAYIRRDGSFADIKCYALLKDEWRRQVLAR